MCWRRTKQVLAQLYSKPSIRKVTKAERILSRPIGKKATSVINKRFNLIAILSTQFIPYFRNQRKSQYVRYSKGTSLWLFNPAGMSIPIRRRTSFIPLAFAQRTLSYINSFLECFRSIKEPFKISIIQNTFSPNTQLISSLKYAR